MPSKERTPALADALRTRVANPPPHFVGRRAELARLVGLLEHGALALVTGSGGSGKTALARVVLHRRFSEHAARAVRVAVRDGDGAVNVLADTLRALSPERKGNEPRLGDPSALLATAVDVADEKRAWIVVEDAHRGDAESLRDLFRTIAEHARASHWLVTCRDGPLALALSIRAVALGSMKERELAMLARRAHPAATKREVEEMVAGARGSPWTLLQQAAALAGGLRFAPGHVLGPTTPGMTRLLGTLAAIEVALPEREIAALGAFGEDLRALTERGIVEQSDCALRLHDVARDLLARAPHPSPDGRVDRAALAVALGASDEPACLLESVRLFVELGRDDEAAARLDHGGEHLVASGHALRLAKSIGATSSLTLARWRVRCAVELDDAAALAREREPPATTGLDRFVWARALATQGRLDAAIERAVAIAAEGDGSPAFLFKVRHAAARWSADLGHHAKALEFLESTPAPDASAAAMNASRAALYLVRLGRRDEALARLEEAAHLDEVPIDERTEITFALATACLDLGDLRRASELVDRALASAAPDADQPRRLFLRGSIDLDLGRLGHAEATFARLALFAGRSRVFGDLIRATELATRLASGRLARLGEDLEDAARALFEQGRFVAERYIEGLRLRLAILRATTDELTPIVEATGNDTSYRNYEICARRAALRRGEASAPPIDLASYAEAELPILARVTEAERRLLEADGDGAVAMAREATELAQSLGYGVFEAEAIAVTCDVLLALGRRRDAAAAAADLAELARTMPSPRFELEARFVRALAERTPDPSTALDLAAAIDVAPVVARRCDALLGGASRLDAIDRLVLRGETERFRTARVERASGSSGRASPAIWVIDELRREVRLPGGRRVDFAKRPLAFRVLLALSDRGGAADKEHLVRAVWRAGYHPLHDDNRLHVAVRKLRADVEDDPARPMRLVTTETGYALGGEVRRLKRD